MENTKKYPWYEIVNGSSPLLQGDFVDSCPVVVPPTAIESERVSAEVIEYDVVTMSQSCDLVQKKLDLVLVCPIWPLKEFENRSDFFKSRKGKEALRQGNVPGYHLRLLSPYREHLSQAFARFFMRVGLPVDIPPFD